MPSGVLRANVATLLQLLSVNRIRVIAKPVLKFGGVLDLIARLTLAAVFASTRSFYRQLFFLGERTQLSSAFARQELQKVLLKGVEAYEYWIYSICSRKLTLLRA